MKKAKQMQHTITIQQAVDRGWCQTGQALITVARKLLPKRIKGFNDNTPIAVDDLVWMTKQKAWRAVSKASLSRHVAYWLPEAKDDFDDVINEITGSLSDTSPSEDLMNILVFAPNLNRARLKKAVATITKAQNAFVKELHALARGE